MYKIWTLYGATLVMCGCGTLYVKPKGTMKTESNVKTESQVTVTIDLNIAEQIERICKDSKDLEECRKSVMSFFDNLIKTLKETNENSNLQQSINGQAGDQQPNI